MANLKRTVAYNRHYTYGADTRATLIEIRQTFLFYFFCKRENNKRVKKGMKEHSSGFDEFLPGMDLG